MALTDLLTTDLPTPDDQLTELLAAIRPSRDWTDEARCKGRTHLFFGAPSERPEARARREALAARYCAVCPVIEDCRSWARARGENGFWGGESEEDRAVAGFAPRSITRRSVAEARDSAA
jgi:WhiB family redox-sensing transcriptional regulator